MKSVVNTKRKILHFCPDDKFIDGAMKIFDFCAPGVNDYIVYNRTDASEVKYIKNIDMITFAPPASSRYREIIHECRKGNYAAVVLHSLPSKPWEIIKAMRNNGSIVTITWGHEIYQLMNQKDLLKLTEKTVNVIDKASISLKIRRKVLSLRLNLSKLTPFVFERNLRALLKTDFISPVIEEDYKLFASSYHKHHLPKILPFSYVLDIESVREINLVGDDILVGNSATPTCNHIDVFDKLLSLGVSNKILTPLNYGSAEYAESVRKTGLKLFGDRFISLDNFLSFNEYLSLLKHCKYVVMGHLRQQALGNILLALSMGAKIFFFKANPVFGFLRAQGFLVFSFEEAKAKDFETELDEVSVERNRNGVENNWGWKTLVQKTKNFISTIHPEY